MEKTSPLKSKTLWLNAILVVCGVLASFGVLPSLSAWVSAHSDLVLTALGVVGVGLRLVTKGKISLE